MKELQMPEAEAEQFRKSVGDGLPIKLFFRIKSSSGEHCVPKDYFFSVQKKSITADIIAGYAELNGKAVKLKKLSNK